MAESTAPPRAPVVPYLTVSDADAAIEFYKRAFGATEISRAPTPDGKKLMHAGIAINGGVVYLSDDFPEMAGGKPNTPDGVGGTPVTIHLQMDDVDTPWQKAVDAGATVLMPLEDQFWGDRYGELKDPFGHRWSMAKTVSTPSDNEIREGAKQAFGQP